MFWQSSHPLGSLSAAQAPPRPASSGISGHQARKVNGSEPKQWRRMRSVTPMTIAWNWTGIGGQASASPASSVSHGSPSGLADATQPNQTGQLNGSVSNSPAQPLFGGRPSPDRRYQR